MRIGVMTNTALLYLNVHHQRLLPPMRTSTEILLFVAFEHLVIGAKCVLAFAIPDVPEGVSSNAPKRGYSKIYPNRSRAAVRMASNLCVPYSGIFSEES